MKSTSNPGAKRDPIGIDGEKRDEGCGGDSGVEQDAKVGGGGGGSALPQHALQPLRQAHLQIHGARREQRLQYRRSGPSLCLSLPFPSLFLVSVLRPISINWNLEAFAFVTESQLGH